MALPHRALFHSASVGSFRDNNASFQMFSEEHNVQFSNLSYNCVDPSSGTAETTGRIESGLTEALVLAFWLFGLSLVVEV